MPFPCAPLPPIAPGLFYSYNGIGTGMIWFKQVSGGNGGACTVLQHTYAGTVTSIPAPLVDLVISICWY